MGVTVIIPARYASTRFPGKPLADLCGKPLVQWVYERSSRCEAVDKVIVATDDQRIADAVMAFGGEVVMTRADHATGTDRLAEVAETIDDELIVNVTDHFINCLNGKTIQDKIRQGSGRRLLG